MNKQRYYQGKFEYYRTMNTWVVIAICLASIGYFFSDCYLLGGFCIQTLFPRATILIPLTIFLIINYHTKNYRIVVPMSYFLGHSVMWCTIWACTYLDDLRFACVGFFIVLFIFLPLGIASPIQYEIIGHGLLFVDIAIANTFVHYPDYAMMFLLGIPLYMGAIVYEIAMEKVYRDQAIAKQQLEESLHHDALTGAYNRNIIKSLVDEQNRFSIASSDSLAVILYDLDKFKCINDTYGHAAGDTALIEISKAVESRLHEGEFLIRWGGEEFILLLKGENGDFYERAENFRQTVENLSLPTGKTTISIGLAKYHGEDYQTVIKHADAALYQAKNNGRNRVVMYPQVRT